MDNTNIDVIIIGGGIAGLATGIECLQLGLKPVIIERRKVSKPKPGETLHPGIDILLQQLGIQALDSVEKRIIRHPGIWVQWGTQEWDFHSYSTQDGQEWLGYQIRRTDLVETFIHRYRDLGGQIIYEHVTNIEDHGLSVKVQTKSKFFSAYYIIDATGSKQWFSNFRKIGIQYASQELIAWYGYCQGESSYKYLPSIQSGLNKWSWIAQVSDNLYAWVTVVLESRERLSKQPIPLADLTLTGKIYSEDVTWRITNEPASLTHYCVGDAAFTIDPLSSKGVLKAIFTGITSAQMIADGLKSNIRLVKAIEYSNLVINLFRQETQVLSEFYSIFPENNIRNIEKCLTL